MKYVGTEQFYNTYKIYNLVSVTIFFPVSVLTVSICTTYNKTDSQPDHAQFNHAIFQHVKMSNCSLDPVIEILKKTLYKNNINVNIQSVNKITILLNLLML